MLTGSRISEVLKKYLVVGMLFTVYVYQSLLFRSMESIAVICNSCMILQLWIFSLYINCGVLRHIKEFRNVI